MTDAAARLLAERAAVGVAAFTSPDYRPGEVLHIVLFRFAASATVEDRQAVRERFLALAGACRREGHPYIRDIAGGTPNGGEGAERGFEQAYVLRFASEGDRNYYVGEPVVSDPAHFDAVHGDFKRFVGPLLAPDGALVFDFANRQP